MITGLISIIVPLLFNSVFIGLVSLFFFICFVLLMSHLCNDKAKQLGSQMGLIMKEFVEDALP